MFKATNWSGLESSLSDLRRAPFYPGLDRETKDALHVYDVMKECCRRNGHTYLLLDDVQRFYAWASHARYKGHEVRGFYAAMW